LGFVTRTENLELETHKQFGMPMKEHRTLLSITANTKGFKLGAQPFHGFTPYKKGHPLVKDDETIGREFLC
jgi:hypothetical protein